MVSFLRLDSENEDLLLRVIVSIFNVHFDSLLGFWGTVG